MGSFPIQPDSLGSLIASLEAGHSRLATSPAPDHSTIKNGATTVIDGNNEPRVAFGLYEWPHGPHAGASIYGLVAFDGSGNPIVVVGQQPDGSYGVGIYDTSGDKINELDSAGLHSFDAVGNERARLGRLSSGDYGFNVTDPNGNGRELLPTYQAFAEYDPGGLVWTTTSTTPSAPSGGPSVSAYFGASGDAMITASGTMWIAAGNGAYLTLAIDGTAVGTYPVLYSLAQGSVSCSVRFQLSKFPGMATVTPNTTHTVRFLISSASGGAQASFQGLGLSVEPI